MKDKKSFSKYVAEKRKQTGLTQEELAKISLIDTFLVYLLLFTINFVNKGAWLLESYIIASFVFSFPWLAILICT